MFKTGMHALNDKLNFHIKIKSGDKHIFMFTFSTVIAKKLLGQN